MIHSFEHIKLFKHTRTKRSERRQVCRNHCPSFYLVTFPTEIKEMDINPLLATEKSVIAVDARIRIKKKKKRAIF
jgi:acetyltransferase